MAKTDVTFSFTCIYQALTPLGTLEIKTLSKKVDLFRFPRNLNSKHRKFVFYVWSSNFSFMLIRPQNKKAKKGIFFEKLSTLNMSSVTRTVPPHTNATASILYSASLC